MDTIDLKHVGIFVNPRKDPTMKGAQLVAQHLRAAGVHVFFDAGGMPPGEHEIINYRNIDCLFVLGGDGTLLKAATKASAHRVCLLGINLGRLGFLSEVELSDIGAAIARLQSGDYFVEERMMLHCSVYNADKKLHEAEALNDVAILKKDVSRMVRLELSIRGAIADRVACDGMLVSTPTGSTGYSMSAGGPILSPELKCLLATPICPHSLHSRPLVVSADDEIVIRSTAPGGMVLTTDGVQQRNIHNGEIVRIKRSRHLARFIRFHENYFYPLLRSKFANWDR